MMIPRSAASALMRRAALAILLLLAALPGRTAPPTGVAAAGGVALALSPAQTQVITNEEFTLDLTVNAGSQPFDAADVALDFDPARLRVVNAGGSLADQITPAPGLGAAGVTLLRNRADNAAGRIDFSFGRGTDTPPLTGAFVAATLRFMAVAPSPATVVQFSTQTARPTGVFFQGAPVLGALTPARVGIAGVRLSLSPAVQPLAAGQTVTLTLAADATHQPVDALDAYLDFDPARLRLVDGAGADATAVTPGANLPAGVAVLRNQGDNALGRIVFSVGRDPQQGGGGSPVSAAFTLATVRLKALAPGTGAGLRFSTAPPRATAAFLAGAPVTGPLQDAALPVNGAALRLSPATASGPVNGAPVALDIMVDAGTQGVDAIDVFLRFDPALARAVDAGGADASGIAPDTAALGQVLRNQIDHSAGRVAFSIGRETSAAPAAGSFRIGTLRLKGLAAGAAGVTFSQAPPDLTAVFAGPENVTGAIQGAQITFAAERLAFTGQPIRAAARYDFGVAPKAAHVNGSGAVQTGDAQTVVTLGIAAGTGTPDAALTCTGGRTRTVAAGAAVFDGCQIDLPGAGYVLEATAAGLPAGRTAPFNVTLAGDVDAGLSGGVCRVSAVDFSLLVTHFNKSDQHGDWLDAAKRAFRADLNGSGAISAVDFSILVTEFGAAAQPPCVAPSDGSPAPTP